jgi:hypothetical protein
MDTKESSATSSGVLRSTFFACMRAKLINVFLAEMYSHACKRNLMRLILPLNRHNCADDLHNLPRRVASLWLYAMRLSVVSAISSDVRSRGKFIQIAAWNSAGGGADHDSFLMPLDHANKFPRYEI